MELTAVNNPQVKAAAELKQKKYRDKEKKFIDTNTSSYHYKTVRYTHC